MFQLGREEDARTKLAELTQLIGSTTAADPSEAGSFLSEATSLIGRDAERK